MKERLAILATCVATVLAAAICVADIHAAEAKVDFNREIRPLLVKHCFACHGPDEGHREAGLRLDLREGATAKLDSDAIAIVAGKSGASELFRRLTADDAERMPPVETGITLTPAQIALFKRWIDEGASYAPHWAFVKPQRPPLPRVAERGWPLGGIDYFALARLEREGLSPQPRADRHALIRRVSLDLRGLPPTPEEVARFVADPDPLAYQKLVDRLLDDAAFGERWARMWLDQARYADSRGYGSDPLRPNIWRYRDWVIDAFNDNKPFDEFTIEQIAGDLLPQATPQQKLATAFHRNTMTNTEGGTDDEEFRVAAVKDRVDTTMQVWMGVTMGCAQCHSHKYEPITHQEYYQLFAIFNQTADSDKGDEFPTLIAPSRDYEQRLQQYAAKLASLRAKLDAPAPKIAAAQAKWEQGLELKAAWSTLRPDAFTSKQGATLERLEDQSLLVSGKSPATDIYEISATTDLSGITALRLEALPDASLPGGGPGRSASGNFVLSRFTATAENAEQATGAVTARYVRIELPGPGKMLSLAEVQVYAGQQNVAAQGKASQSSTAYAGAANLAIDGNTNGDYFAAQSTTHTNVEANPWWEVALNAPQPVERVVLWNRTDGNLESRLAGYRVQLLDDARKVIWEASPREVPQPSQELTTGGVRSIAFSPTPAADHSQAGFAVAGAVAAGDLASAGWAIAPQLGQPHWAVFVPTTPLSGSKKTRLHFTLQQQFKESLHTLGRFRLSATTDKNITARLAVPAKILAIVDLPAASRSAEQQAQLAAHYRSIAPALKKVRDEIAAWEKSKPLPPAVPVMQELAADKRRTTHIMLKGNFLSPGERVEPGLPSAFHPLPQNSQPDRLGVAHWLVHEDNPLTARVAANRFWAQLFGVGIVETEEDFGIQGEPPSHPALLDWLATEFVALDWDVKALLKTIVTSQTYCQSSRITPEALAKDPANRLFSRGPRFRLEAEMVRDQALALSGLLSRKLRGPSVFPPQPPGLWQAAFNGERTWKTSTGEDSHRRGLYTFWRRTIPYPSMTTFDAPSREICALRRIRTNTPLQAFVTLNDPVYVEAAQALSRRLVREGGQTPAERAAWGLQLCLARPAREQQTQALTQLYETELAHYRSDPAAAKQMIGATLGPLPDGVEEAELAAWTVVANVLLNLDGVLMKG